MKELSLLSSMPNISTPAYDSNALNKLKYQVGQNADQQGLRQVAQQLEGVFVQMMLKVCVKLFHKRVCSIQKALKCTPLFMISKLLKIYPKRLGVC